MSEPERASTFHIGCAGWSLPRALQSRFPEAGSHLERYAARLPAVEINSSFYRPHQPATYRRWAESVPPEFRFSVKVPREITHQRRLRDPEPPLDRFLSEAASLGDRLGCLLIQLPPSLVFQPGVAEAFLDAFRQRWEGSAVLEPRHPTWLTPEAEHLLQARQIGRVAADPAPAPGAGDPGGWPDILYFRLHGSPRIYYSNYDEAYLDALAARLETAARAGVPVWCIFDNTAEGAATANALSLLERLSKRRGA